jgi:hypothetical protein
MRVRVVAAVAVEATVAAVVVVAVVVLAAAQVPAWATCHLELALWWGIGFFESDWTM